MKVRTSKEMNNPLGVWLLGIIISILLTGVLAPIAIWINIEHGEILYQSRIVQASLTRNKELRAKLEVEHSRLISPYQLEEQARQFSMAMASSGQVRRLFPAQELEEIKQEKAARARELEEKLLLEKEKAQLALLQAEEERLSQENEQNNFILQEKAEEKTLKNFYIHTISREMLFDYIEKVSAIELSEFSSPKIEAE